MGDSGRQLVRRRCRRTVENCGNFLGLQVQGVVHEVDAAALEQAASELDQGEAEQTRGGRVAVQAAFVTQPVHQTRLRQEIVELVTVLVGHLGAEFVGDLLGAALRRVAVVIEAAADPVEEDVGSLTDRRVGEVEARRQPVAAACEVLLDRRDATAEFGQPLRGRRITGEQSLRLGVGMYGVDGGHQLRWHHPGHGGPSVVDSEHRHRRGTGPPHCVENEVAHRQHRRCVESMVLVRHVGQPLNPLAELIEQRIVVERGEIDLGELPVLRDRRWLELVVPTLQHVAPDPLLECRSGETRATTDLGSQVLGRSLTVRSRCVERNGLHVRESVDVHDVHRVEQRTPRLQRLGEPTLHSRRVRRLHQRRDRRRQMGAVLQPRTWPRRLPHDSLSSHVHPSLLEAHGVRTTARLTLGQCGTGISGDRIVRHRRRPPTTACPPAVVRRRHGRSCCAESPATSGASTSTDMVRR